jgi:hypothetical protein
MSYLQHRLILAFFECGLCFNLNDSHAQLNDVVEFLPICRKTEIDFNLKKPSKLSGPHKSKPFKMRGLYFYSKNDYIAFCNSLNAVERKKFIAVPTLRKKLEQNVNNFATDIHYLTPEQILEGKKKPFIYKTGCC